MVLSGEPATRRRCWKVQTHIATPGAVSLSAYPGLSWGLPALFNSSTVFTDVYGRWSLLGLLSEFLLYVISLPESDRMDGYIALLWYFSKNCLRCPSVKRSRFLLRCLDIAYVLPFGTQNSKCLLIPRPCSLSLCHQVWQPDPMPSLRSLISAVLKFHSISSDLPDPEYYRKLEMRDEVPARHFYRKTKQDQVMAWPHGLWGKRRIFWGDVWAEVVSDLKGFFQKMYE